MIVVFDKVDKPSVNGLLPYTEVKYWDYTGKGCYYVKKYPHQDPAVNSLTQYQRINAIPLGGVETERGDSVSPEELTDLMIYLLENNGSSSSGGSSTSVTAAQIIADPEIQKLIKGVYVGAQADTNLTPKVKNRVQAGFNYNLAAGVIGDWVEIAVTSGASASTITPDTTNTIGNAGLLTIEPGTDVTLYFNGTNWETYGLDAVAPVPPNYTGLKGKIQQVNTAETSLEFVTQNGYLLGSSNKFANLPIVNGSKKVGVGDWAYLIEKDGSNEVGFYQYDGSVYVWKFGSTIDENYVDLPTSGAITVRAKNRLTPGVGYTLASGSAGDWVEILVTAGTGSAAISSSPTDKIAGVSGAYSVNAGQRISLLYNSATKDWEAYGVSTAAASGTYGGLEYSNWGGKLADSAARTRPSGDTFASYISARIGNSVAFPIEENLTATDVCVALGIGNLAPITNLPINIKPVFVRTSAGNTTYNNTDIIPDGIYICSYNGIEVVLDAIEQDAVATAAIANLKGATATVAGVAGLTPAPAAGDQGKYLKGDGTWSSPTSSVVMTGATATDTGVTGTVPAPATTDRSKFLKGDGSWSVVAPMAGATAADAGAAGVVPSPAAGEQSKYLKGDGSWGTPVPANLSGATASVAGTAGAAPAPAAGDQGKYLKGDGTWAIVPSSAPMAGASTTVAGTGGTVPAPAIGDQIKYLKGDGTWSTPPSSSPMVGATTTAAGTGGTVPIPEIGENTKYLKGDGTWSTPPSSSPMVGATATAAGTGGTVPAPAIGENTKYLKGDGTWATIPSSAVMTGATATTAGVTGTVPAPAAADDAKFLKGDGSWAVPAAPALATGATATTAGTAGLLPAAPAGNVGDVLTRAGNYAAIPANGSLIGKYTPASGLPSGAGIRAGDYYIVETDGLVNQPFAGVILKAGDEVVALKAAPSVAADWYLRARATAYQAGTIDNVVTGDTVEHTFTGTVARDSILRVNNRNSAIALYSNDSNLTYGSTVSNGARYAISAVDGKIYRATVATVTDRTKDPSVNLSEWAVLQSTAAPLLANSEVVNPGDLRSVAIASVRSIIRYGGAAVRTTATAATTTDLATEFGNGWDLVSQDSIPTFAASTWYPDGFEVLSNGNYYKNLVSAVGAVADLTDAAKWQVLAGTSRPPAPEFTDGETIRPGDLRSVTIAGIVTTIRYGGAANRTINVLSIATDLSTEFNAGWALISQSQIPTFSVGVWYPAGFEVKHQDGHYRNLVSATGATIDLADTAKWQLLATVGGFLIRSTIISSSTATLANLREYVGAAGATGTASPKIPSAIATNQRIEFINGDGGTYNFSLETVGDRLTGVVNGTISSNRKGEHLIFVCNTIGEWTELNRKTQYEFSLGGLMGWPGAAVPDDGWLPMSGGVYNRVDYPELSALITAGRIAITSSTTATTFTLKNLNTGAAAGAGYFLGGLGGQSAGTLQDDSTAVNGLRHVVGGGGVITVDNALGMPTANSNWTNSNGGTAPDRVMQGDAETRPYTARVLWVVRAKPQPLILGDGATLNINSQTIRHTVTFNNVAIGLSSEFTWSLVRIPVTAGQQLDTVSASVGQAYIVDALGGTVGVIAPAGGGTINITKTEIAQTYAVTLGGVAINPAVAVRLNSWTTIKIPVTAGQQLSAIAVTGGTSPQAVIKDAANGFIDVLATTAAINLTKTETPLTYSVTLGGAALTPAVTVRPNVWTTIKIPVTAGQRLATVAVTGGTSPGANILDPNNGLVSVLATTAAINLVKTESPLTYAITNAGVAFAPVVAISAKSWTMLKLTVAAGRQLATVTATGGTAPKASIIDHRSGLVAVYLDDAAIDITSTNEAIANTLDLVQTAKFTWDNKSLVTAGGESSSFIKSTQSSTGSAIDLNTTKSRLILTQGFTYRVRVQVTRGAGFTNWVAYKVQGDLGAGAVDIPDTAFYFGDDNSNFQGGGGTEFYLNVPSTATAPYSLWLLRTNSGGNGNSSGEWNVEAIAKESGTTLPAALPIRTITNANGSNVNGVVSVPGYDGYPVQIQVTLTAGRAIASATVTNGTISVLNAIAGLVLVTPNSGNPVITITDTATSPLFSNWQKDVSTYTDNTWRTVGVAAETNGLFTVNANGELTFNRDAVIDASITNVFSEGSGLSLGYKIQTRGTGNVWYDIESLSVNNPASGVTPFVVKTSGLGISTGQMLRFQCNVNNGGANAYPGARTVRLFVGEQLSTFVVPVGTTTRTVCTVTGVGANINGNATAQILGGTSGAVTATVPANQRLATVAGSAGLTVAIEEAVTGRISYSLTEGTIAANLTMTFSPIPPITTNVTATVDTVASNVNGNNTFVASNGGTRSEVLITLPAGRQLAGVTASGGATVGITNPRSGSVSLLIPAGLASCALTATTVVSTARALFTTTNSGVAVRFGTIELRMSPSGNRSAQIKSAGGNLSLRVLTWLDWQTTNQPTTVTVNDTTWGYVTGGSSYNYGASGNQQNILIEDITNGSRIYKIMMTVGSGYNGNSWFMEEVI